MVINIVVNQKNTDSILFALGVGEHGRHTASGGLSSIDLGTQATPVGVKYKPAL